MRQARVRTARIAPDVFRAVPLNAFPELGYSFTAPVSEDT